MATVKFVSGEEKEFQVDSAGCDGPLFVLYTYNRQRRKSESGQVFPKETVVHATFADGRIVLGGGKLSPTATSYPR